MTISVPAKKFIATVGPPYIDESLRGYLGRALSVTAVRNIASLLKLADATKPNAVSLATTLTDEGEIERIATLIGCTSEDIVSRIYRTGKIAHSGSESIDFFGTQLRLHFRETRDRRVSPRALEIAQYHRALDELRPFAYSTLTQEKMLGICPACNRKLGWLRADVPFLCDKCDADLRDYPQPVSPAEDEEAYDFAVSLVDPDPAKKHAARKLLPEAWSGYSNGALFETTIALASGLTADPAGGVSAQGRGKRREHFEALTPNMLALAGRAIIGGDGGFATLCESYRTDMEKRPSNYGRRKELGPLAYITYDKHLEPGIRELLGSLVDANMQTTCRDYSVRKGRDADAAMLTIQQLAKELGVRRKILQRLANSGLIPVARAQGAQSPVRMAMRDITPLLLQLKDAISERAAAGLLGLPVTVLPSLVDRGLIRRLQGPVCGLLPDSSGYSKSSIEDLMNKVWSAASPAPENCTSIAVAARAIGFGEVPWAAVISAIVADTVKVFDKGANYRNIRFSLGVCDVEEFAAGVNKFHNAPSNIEASEWIAQSTAAEILHVNVAFVSRLTHARPDLLSKRGPGHTPYSSVEVRSFAGAQIFVPEIARRIGMHHRRVPTWLRSKGVHPNITLQENRDFGYLRLSVEPFLENFAAENRQSQALLDDANETERTKLIKAVAAGGGAKATAQAMGVPYRQAVRWIEVWRNTGAVGERKFGRRSKLDVHEDLMRKIVADRPTITLARLHEAMTGRGVKTSETAIWNALRRFGIALTDRDERHTTDTDIQKHPSDC